jgi:c(7)-type cytochrome triheme protein
MPCRVFPLLLSGCLMLSAAAVFPQGVRDYALRESLVLQQQSVATMGLPKGIDGRPDWVRALQQGLIQPRSTVGGMPRPIEPWGAAPKEGIVFSNTQFMPHVVFPHQPHVEWLACANCHDQLFPRQATGKGQGMTAIFQGRHCGFCHGRVAFSPEGSCYRCHSKPNPTAVQNNSPFMAPTQVEQGPSQQEEAPSDAGRRRKPVAPTNPSGFAPARIPPASAEVPPLPIP